MGHKRLAYSELILATGVALVSALFGQAIFVLVAAIFMAQGALFAGYCIGVEEARDD